MTLPTPFSYTQFDGDGLETSFSFTWDYINKSHVHVYLDDTEVTQGTGNDQWQWDGDKKIAMGTAPTADQELTIRRETPEDAQIVDWQDGSHLIADDLNTSDKQWLYLIQEHHDMLMRIIYGLEPIPGPGLPDDLFGLWNRLARHDDSDKDTTNEKAQTIDSVDQLAGDATSTVQNGVDSYVLTFGAISERLDVIQGDGSNYPGTGNTGQLGKFRVNDDNKLFYWDQTAATPAWVEIVGGQGTPGAAATVDVGTTTTGAAGTNASVTNSGTTSAAILDFTIPRGENGTDGTPGADGVTPDVSVGTTTTGAAGTNASVTNTGTAPNVVLNFTIPRGADGSGAGTVTNVQAGNGINVADGTSTPTVSAVAGDNTITVDGDGIKVNTANLPGQTQSDWTEADTSDPAFIQNKPTIPAAANDGQINVNAGNGLTATGDNATANQAGNTTRTLTVQAADNTITVAAGGISVNTGNLPTPATPTLQQVTDAGATSTTATEFSGSLETSQVFTDPVAIADDTDWDISGSNIFTFAGGTLRFPNAGVVVGQTGLLWITGNITAWGTNAQWEYPGGTLPTAADTGVNAVIPFFVRATNAIVLGTVTQEIA
jgi:hypothetical protein